MCALCKDKTDKKFCEACLLTLEQFNTFYRSGKHLATADGVKALLKEGQYVQRKSDARL